MNKRRTLDCVIMLIGLTVIAVAYCYPEQIREWKTVIWIAGWVSVWFGGMAVIDREGRQRTEYKERTIDIITELVLLSEEETELCIWDIFGKTSVVIGRDMKENQVDIDLNCSHYASMVDIEHAVMNFSAGKWYVEDLGSRNGISLKKVEDGRLYRLSADKPCKVERGDILYVGCNRLLIR